MTCSRMETDGMRYLDDEMSSNERIEFEEHCAQCDDCQQNLQSFRELQSLTRRIKMKDPTDEFWESYWKSIYHRIERKTAWILIIIGAVMLATSVSYQAIRSFGEVTIEKIALVVFIVGIILLLLSVIRERVHHYKADKYKDITR
jgi:anti-sigma factor RsiW